MTHSGHKGAWAGLGAQLGVQGTAHGAQPIPLPKHGFSSWLQCESGSEPAGGSPGDSGRQMSEEVWSSLGLLVTLEEWGWTLRSGLVGGSLTLGGAMQS